jgi:multidrug efflux pump subunit AcrB
MIVSLTSADNSRGTLYRSNYATLQIMDDLARIPAVGAVILLGERDYSMRVWIDPARLAARNLGPKDVVDAIRAQNVQVAAGRIGQPPTPKGQEFELKFDTKGRLTDPKDFDDIVIKADGQGGIVRLKNVGRTELGVDGTDSHVSFNGKPAVSLCIYPTGAESPKQLSQAVADKVAKLCTKLPAGLQFEVAFDFTANLEDPGGTMRRRDDEAAGR